MDPDHLCSPTAGVPVPGTKSNRNDQTVFTSDLRERSVELPMIALLSIADVDRHDVADRHRP